MRIRWPKLIRARFRRLQKLTMVMAIQKRAVPFWPKLSLDESSTSSVISLWLSSISPYWASAPWPVNIYTRTEYQRWSLAHTRLLRASGGILGTLVHVYTCLRRRICLERTSISFQSEVTCLVLL